MSREGLCSTLMSLQLKPREEVVTQLFQHQNSSSMDSTKCLKTNELRCLNFSFRPK